MKKLVVKLGLRKELREARRQNDNERVSLIIAVLADDDILELATLATVAEFEYEEELNLAGGGFGDFIQRFFAFFQEHKEEILAFLQIVLALCLAEKPSTHVLKNLRNGSTITGYSATGDMEDDG